MKNIHFSNNCCTFMPRASRACSYRLYVHIIIGQSKRKRVSYSFVVRSARIRIAEIWKSRKYPAPKGGNVPSYWSNDKGLIYVSSNYNMKTGTHGGHEEEHKE